MNSHDNYWLRRIGRRTFLRSSLAGSMGAGALVLVGCGDDDDDDDGGETPTGGTATVGPTPTTSSGLPSGGSIVGLQASDPTSLDPHFGQGGGDHQYFWTMHDNLVNYNQRGELDASISLAEDWELADDTTILMTLRQNVQFHDGTPFDGDAVKFNIERAQSETSAARSQMLPIVGVEVISATEVRLTLDKPNAAILTLLGDRGGAIVSPAAAEEFGDELGRNPVGTGMFVFAEWAQSDHITVSRNPNYWGVDAAGTALPYLDELRWNIVPDATVQVANLEAGTADVIGLSAGDVARFQSNDDYRVQESATGTGWGGIYAHQSLAPIDDPRLRRAIGRAIDKAALVQAVTFGLATPAIGPIAVGTWAYNPDLQGLDFDLDEARKELDASGYPDGVEIEMITINTSYYEQQAELVKQMLTEIGVTLNVVPVAVAELTNRTFVLRDAAMQLAGFSLRADPDGTISETLRSDGFYNPGRRENVELDTLIDNARQTYDQEERKGFYDQIQQIAIDEVYDWFFFYGRGYTAAQKHVLNLEQYYGGEAKPRWANLAREA